MTAPIGGIQGPGEIRRPDQAGIPLGDLPKGSSFKDTLAAALGDVSNMQDETRDTIAAFVRRDPNVTIHDVMAASEEASLSLQLLVEMRNKLTEAYHALMNMQT
jgi:flagellar hook-basal body complex protein FliE